MIGTEVGTATETHLERTYREAGPRLWRAVFLYAGDREIASDAVAEAFAQALSRGEALRDPERWVWRTAFRIAAGQLKERRRQVALTEDARAAVPKDVADLTRAVAALPRRQRAVVVLHYYGGYRTKEIAALLGSTRPAVGMHLTRARRRLRALLEDSDE